MAKNRDPFGVVLRTLSQRLRTGAYPAGDPLTIVTLARDLRLSPTPVREALSRLAGQGLIEDIPGRGYFARGLQASDLAELYHVHELYIAAGLRAAQGQADQFPNDSLFGDALTTCEPPWDDDERVRAAERLFDYVVLQTGNAALRRALARLADRLAPARRVENQVVRETAEEIQALGALLAAGAWPEAEVALRAYHDRRIALAAAIAAAHARVGNYSSDIV